MEPCISHLLRGIDKKTIYGQHFLCKVEIKKKTVTETETETVVKGTVLGLVPLIMDF